MSEEKNIEIINSLIRQSKDKKLMELLPIEKEKMYDDEVCDLIIDFLSDIQMIRGFDINYNETEEGKKISAAIDFISLCNERLI